MNHSDDTRTWAASPQALRIGRAEDNDVVLDDSHVSKHHAELRHSAHGWDIRDLGSSNGTEVNGQPVQAAEARAGDVLRVGSTWLRLSTTGVELAEASALAAVSAASAAATIGLPHKPGDVVNGQRLSGDGTQGEPIQAPPRRKTGRKAMAG